VADGRELVANVPIRCCAPSESFAPGGICGEPACWERPDAELGGAHFCDVHRGPTDVAIAGVAIVRRVHVVAEIVFNAARTGRAASEDEAVTRLLDAVRAAGGAVSLHAVTTDVGRQPIPVLAGVTSGRRGRGGPGG